MTPGLFKPTLRPTLPSESADQTGGADLSRRKLGLAVLSAGLLAGCGFKLRGAQTFAFSSIAILPNPGGAVSQELRRAFGGTVQVLPAGVPVAQAQVVLTVLGETREKTVVGVNASGQVRELQLRLRVRMKLDTPAGKELITETDITQQRDISFSETAVLAKEAEEGMLYRDMQADIAQQILRRLAAIKQVQ